jgi:hypothetical protein
MALPDDRGSLSPRRIARIHEYAQRLAGLVPEAAGEVHPSSAAASCLNWSAGQHITAAGATTPSPTAGVLSHPAGMLLAGLTGRGLWLPSAGSIDSTAGSHAVTSRGQQAAAAACGRSSAASSAALALQAVESVEQLAACMDISESAVSQLV